MRKKMMKKMMKVMVMGRVVVVVIVQEVVLCAGKDVQCGSTYITTQVTAVM
jgi:hypothetical protein